MDNPLIVKKENDSYNDTANEETDIMVSPILEKVTVGDNYGDNDGSGDIELEDININQIIITNGDGSDDDDGDDGSGFKLTRKQEKSFSNYIMLSHFITRMGDKSWSFIVPLFLISLSPNSLLPISLFGLSTSIFRIIFGPSIGKITDKYKKVQVIKLGIWTQAFTIGISCISLFILFETVTIYGDKDSSSNSSGSNSNGSSGGSNLTSDFLSNGISIGLFIVLMLFSSIHSLAGSLMDISVERKWMPSIVKRDTRLTFVNTRMRQIDLGTEMLAPFLAGLVAQYGGITAFVYIGIFNFLSFFPQYILLKIVYQRVSITNLKIDKEGLIDFKDGHDLSSIFKKQDSDNGDGDGDILLKEKQTFGQKVKHVILGEWNPFTNIINGWIIFKEQTVFLVIISYCLLWFTVLSPHDTVLTSYLSNHSNGGGDGYTYIELSIFRGLGALFGLGSTLLYSKFIKLLNGSMNKASLIYIFEEGVMVLISGFFFSSTNWKKYIFMASIILSRCGLYGFELTEIHYVQRLVDHSNRGIVSGVESSLCSLATLTMFIISLSANSTDNFYILVYLSISFVLAGGLSLFIWWCKYGIKM